MLVTRSFLLSLRQFSDTNLSFDVTVRRLVNYECVFCWFFCIVSAEFFSQNQLIRKILPEIPFVPNSLDPDQAPPNVGTEFGPSRLQRLSADNSIGQKLIISFVTVGSIPLNTSKCIELSFISDYNLHFHMSKHDIIYNRHNRIFD